MGRHRRVALAAVLGLTVAAIAAGTAIADPINGAYARTITAACGEQSDAFTG
jgi:hypothetical protein